MRGCSLGLAPCVIVWVIGHFIFWNGTQASSNGSDWDSDSDKQWLVIVHKCQDAVRGFAAVRSGDADFGGQGCCGGGLHDMMSD